MTTSDSFILRVEGVSKKFCVSLKRSLWYGLKDLASELCLRDASPQRLRRDEFWALDGLSFDMKRGEVLGIVGQNGAGKSTLLKLINGILKPNAGRIRVRGKVGALTALGAGFSPVLTGRENIYINAAILGFGRKEVNHLLPSIIDFAELGSFINAPVQSYSSGMKVRLGFAIAANLKPDLLLLDEIFSAGDSSFRARCLSTITKFRHTGGSIVFVSHNSVAVQSISDRVLWLEQGKIVALGDPAEIIRRYEGSQLELSRKAEMRRLRMPGSSVSGGLRIISAATFDRSGLPRSEFEFGEPFEIRIRYESEQGCGKPYFVISLEKDFHKSFFVTNMSMSWDDRIAASEGTGSVHCRIKNPVLSPGVYQFHVGAIHRASGQLGEKWRLPLTPVNSFIIAPGKLGDRFPNLPADHLVSKMPPVVSDFDWAVED